ncbi:hypothetical protein ACVJMZ_005927 [Sinorhizobium medicae]
MRRVIGIDIERSASWFSGKTFGSTMVVVLI